MMRSKVQQMMGPALRNCNAFTIVNLVYRAKQHESKVKYYEITNHDYLH
jgi:hypothetical protein